MADRAVYARNHGLVSGTGVVAHDTAVGVVKGGWNWGRIGAAVTGVTAMVGLASFTSGAGLLIAGTVGALGLVGGVAVGGIVGTLLGATFGGVGGIDKGLDRQHAESQAYRQTRAQENVMGLQSQQIQQQNQAMQNIMMAQAMQAEAAQQADVPSMKVNAALAEPQTELTPSAHAQETIPGLAEAANDNDMKQMLDALKANDNASHADKALAESALSENQEATR